MPADGSASSTAMWSAVVPVKRLASAKTRIALPSDERAELAVAMALDTIMAILECSVVVDLVVVTDEQRMAAALVGTAARVVADQPAAGLNAALAHGRQEASQPLVAMVSSDLPALAAADLGVVLMHAAGSSAAAVADAEGTGTTILMVHRDASVQPQFGPGSFTAHLAAGAEDLTGIAAPGLRRDVDTLAALETAQVLGTGFRTAAFWTSRSARGR